MEQSSRNHIALCILKDCPPEARDDHDVVAMAICDGANWEELSKMPELDRWPETYTYLREQFKSD